MDNYQINRDCKKRQASYFPELWKCDKLRARAQKLGISDLGMAGVREFGLLFEACGACGAARDRANRARRERHQAYSDCGMVRVRGAMGGTHYE